MYNKIVSASLWMENLIFYVHGTARVPYSMPQEFNSYPFSFLLQQPIDHRIMANSHSSTIHKEDGYSG